MAIAPKTAGGRATEAGMAFQAGVGLWFAAHVASEMPVGGRFGLGVNIRPTGLQFEIGKYLDDVVVELSNGGTLYVQCKTAPSLSSAKDAPLASTIKQLVELYSALKSRVLAENEKHVAAILAVGKDASGRLNELERALRSFDLGGRWNEVKHASSQGLLGALEVFEAAARVAWHEATGTEITEDDLVGLARLFHISRFDMDVGQTDWREASRNIGSRLFGRDEDGEAALVGLQKVVRSLMRTGAPTDQAGLVKALRAEGLEDTRNPTYDSDIERLRQASRNEVGRLLRHNRLPVNGGIQIPRDCSTALASAIEQGSLLVTGEPGSGKTGVLVELAGRQLAQLSPVVFLSVDRLAGVATSEGLRDELRLNHPLLDVLAAWPGSAPGVFFVDALDASRGGSSENVFGCLIEDAVARLGDRWSVVASIRTFDLQNGRRFRTIMAGSPPSTEYREPSLDAVRHFRIPRLSDGEIDVLAGLHPELGRLVHGAPPSLRKLLHNVFNLSLAAELVADGVSADSISAITTQSDLIDRYENERLPTARLQEVVAKTVQVMVERRRLAVRKVMVGHEAIDDALKTGVLAEAGDRIAFAHHVLFDHAAGRFFLEWDDPEELKAQVTEDPTVGFLLGPSLRFAMERIWREDSTGKPNTWRFVSAMTAANTSTPVVASVALRAAAERVAETQDVESLCEMLLARRDIEANGSTLSRLARFVSMSISEAGSIDSSAAVAWANVAGAAIAANERHYADGARFILWALFEKGNFSDTAFAHAFGRAARALLAFAWAADPPMPVLSSNAIRFVSKTFGTDPAASKALLQQVLEEPRFTSHVSEEGPWLAEGVPSIVAHDAEFTAHIYTVLFGRSAPQDGKTWLGGHASRILPLSSSRHQDYEHGRWHLQQALPAFLKASPAMGTRAVSAATIGSARGGRARDRTREPQTIVAGSYKLIVVEDYESLQEWRESAVRHSGPEEDALRTFVKFLRECPADQFRVAVETAISEEIATSVWARLFGVGADRRGVADDLLWEVASSVPVIAVGGMSRDAIIYASAMFPNRTAEERQKLEVDFLAKVASSDENERSWWTSLVARFLSGVPVEALVTPEMSSLRSQLESEQRLTGNRPFMSIETSYGPADDITDRLLERSGVNLEQGPDKQVRAVGKSLELLLDQQGGIKDATGIAELWKSMAVIVAAMDQQTSPPLHSETLHATWGTASNAAERIAKSELYTPGRDDHPTLPDFIAILDRMASSPYPEGREQSGSSHMAWGNWDVRVYAASSLMALARRFADQHPDLIARLRNMLVDPDPPVRLQIAQSLNALWNIARPEMWELIDFVGDHEAHPGVLGFFLGGPIARLTGTESERCEPIIQKILDRLPASKDSKEDDRRTNLEEAVGHLAAQVWVGKGRPAGKTWMEKWISCLCDNRQYLWHFVSALRGALFLRYAKDSTARDRAIQDRAREALEMIVRAAAEASVEASAAHSQAVTDAERQSAERLYQAGDILLNHSCNQLYFGSGAFKNRDEEKPGLVEPAAMRAFLDEYRDILSLIGQAGGPRTIHHLVELYEFLTVAAPETVFDSISELLVGPAAREGYHFESLGSDVLVRLVRRYLADHRNVFDDVGRRERLVRVLELFSSAGSPEALKLLYDLPDVLR